MSEQSPYIRLKPWLHPFPEPEAVFAPAEQNGGVSPGQAAHVAPPLLSIDLQAVNPDWQGRIHIVSVFENGIINNGYFAEGLAEFHSYYTRTNWIGFHLDEHNRYSLAGDWRCFYAMSGDDAVRNHSDVLKTYADAHKSLNESRAFYAAHQDLLFSKGRRYGKQYPAFYSDWVPGRDILAQWSAGRVAPEETNWMESHSDMDFPLIWVTTPDNERWLCPITEDGRPFIYIASVSGYQYYEWGPDCILLFYDPVTRIALQTFDWT